MCDQGGRSCNSCANNSQGVGNVADIEDYLLQIGTLRRQNQRLQQQLSEAGVRRSPRPDTDRSKLRSARWFNEEKNPGVSAAYAERYFNSGLTPEELQSNKPIIGIAQSGSDLTPCNRHHLLLAQRVRAGIRAAGGVPLEFPTHPIQESTRRPTAALDRNLAYLGLVELLHGYPLDGVVLLTGCDKTTPAFLMAAATVNIPTICMNVGPMLNGHLEGSSARVGSGTIFWKAREEHAAGRIDNDMLIKLVAAGTPSVGHCNTMGTASTMNALAEALGMALPGSAAIPAPYRERTQCGYETGKTIVEMVYSDRKPSDIMTREAFENAIVVNSAIGGSTNAPIHLIAIAKHVGVTLDLDDFDRIGYEIPLILNVQPAGEMLCEEYYQAGGLPAVMAELLDQGKLHAEILTCTGKTIKEVAFGRHSWDRRTIKAYCDPIKARAGFAHLKGNLFDSAIMKTSVISREFREAYLQDVNDPNTFEGRIVVFEGPEDYERRIEDAQTRIDDRTILVMRGVGPLGFPGAAEVVNMRAPSHLLKRGIRSLPCIGDGRQSGTSGSPSILNASPEAALGGNLALIRDGDRLRVDLNSRRVDLLLSEDELDKRRKEMEDQGGFPVPESQTPWQEIFRREVGQLDGGMVLRDAVKYQRVAQRWAVPRHNH
ncbi:dihydroxy-acid dehydratase [Exophiala aquamarina CBS 119918]|uniref:Dihydroxy-acid dehydratase n=1 Tax=Exophiala aquamarina CBS 119918 TaxID=1182545 RepID=A0A072PD80_9EURO|nr:dihydroxy-acid dehydratase [Exophiala aquamarina CBS 119918]KEF57727.1 dihydroxy-acid dehydratase [Exophiala aquamarina CBS 119918]